MTHPTNASRKLPDFVCIGGAKCGTTSLYEYLRTHPEIFLPDQKELHYFSYEDLKNRPEGPGMRSVLRGLISTQEAYEAQFAAMSKEQIAGDISPSYLNEEGAADRILETLGDQVRIIVMLRNPVDRVISQYMHLRRAAREDLPISDALEAEETRIENSWGDMWHYRGSAFAAERVQRYQEKFGAENVHVILIDDLRNDPKSTVSGVLRFIGVDDALEIDVDKEFNRSGSPRSKFVARLVDASPMASVAKRILPRRFGAVLKRKLQELNTGAKEEVPAALREQLSREFVEEVEQLEKVIGRQTGWLSEFRSAT